MTKSLFKRKASSKLLFISILFTLLNFTTEGSDVVKGLAPSGNISCSLMFNSHEKFVFYEFIQSF